MIEGWTALALSADLPPGVAVPGRLRGEDLVIWRSASGRLRAWGDRCPHRGMRLSHGFVRGETLACIYHGWTYDGTGACTLIPAHPDLEPPKSIRTQGYDCREAAGVIFAAAEGTGAALPDPGSLAPVRSLQMEGTTDAVARAAGMGTLADGMVRGTVDLDGAVAVALFLQTSGAGMTTVHALADRAPLAVSDWLERIREIVEG